MGGVKNHKPREPRRHGGKRDAPGMVVHIFSDSTGNLARHMLSACLTQFREPAPEVRLHAFLNHEAKLRDALRALDAQPGAVVHALVRPAAKAMVEQQCQRLGLPYTDLTGSFAQFLAEALHLTPSLDLTRLHKVDAQYQRRISAIDFALEHDDGLGLSTLHEADVVLVGVSRTSKTPTSILLAQEGLKVANVSVTVDVPPPAQLMKLNPDRVLGFVIDPMVLCEIRTRRWRSFGGGPAQQTQYAELDYVERELAWCHRLFRRQGWRRVDVTDQAIEETAARVRLLVAERP